MQAASSVEPVSCTVTRIHFHIKYTIKYWLWGGLVQATNAHFHRDYYKRRNCMGGLLGMTTKSVRSIIQFSKYFTGRLGRSEAYTFEKRQSNGSHIEKIFCRATRSNIRFVRCIMASTLQIYFLHLCVYTCGTADYCCVEAGLLNTGEPSYTVAYIRLKPFFTSKIMPLALRMNSVITCVSFPQQLQ